MKKITIGIIAHVDSGKTTLSEALLYLTGTIRNFGRVDKGASFLDDNDMERRRGITIYSKQARFTAGNTEFTMIDTPGHADFSAEMERALQVLDYAILLISASDGIKGQTETLWRLLKEYRIPVFVFFNKMDQEGADKVFLFNSFRKNFTDEAVDFSLKNDGFYDMAAMCSEEAMNSYLESGMIPDEMITSLIAERRMFPCFFGSALKQEGVRELIDALDRYTVPRSYGDQFGARVYKISRDSDGSRLTMLKITGGVLKNRSQLPDGDSESRVNQIRIYNGNKFTLRDEVHAGEVCALTGLKDSFAGQGFGIEAAKVLPLLVPILNYRAVFPGGEDPVKVLPYFRILEEENPELTVNWDEEHREIYVCVMGEVQLEILKTLLKERFDLIAEFDSGSVMYKETITGPVIGAGHFEPLRHYAEAQFLMEPLPRGSGLVFETRLSSDILAKNWQRLILTHLAEKTHKGVLTGSPITDIKITLISGKAHLKHTEGGDFRQAVYRAVRQGLMMADSILLEPYFRFTLEIPSGNVGRAMTDLDMMKTEFASPELNPEKGTSVISGRGPVSVLKDYPRDIAAYSQGKGSITLVNDGYDICRNMEQVILEKGYDPLSDMRNTPDSVFCAHGSGYIVPFDQVYEHLDVKPFSTDELETEDTVISQGSTAQRDISIGTKEIETIISGISRSGNSDKKSGNSWKRKFGTGSSQAGKGAASADPVKKAGIFAFEEADYVVVDCYNVIFASQDLTDLARRNIDSARDALIDILSRFQSMISGKVMAIFDAYRVKGHARERMVLQDVQLIYTGEEETADQFIEKFTNENGRKSRIVVVTSDGLEQLITRGQGCMLISSRDFFRHVEKLSQGLKDRYDVK